LSQGRLAWAIAAEAARILAERGEADLPAARRKAAARLGVANPREWPDDALMEEALREYQTLFLRHRQPDRLRYLREQAMELMGLLAAFRPRLTGAVLEGLADIHSPIELHLFSERAEDILLRLLDLRLQPQRSDRNYRYPDGLEQRRPLLVLQRDDLVADLSCFPLGELRNRRPLAPSGRGPLRRASRRELEGLLG
jgi:hypothetical protein